VHQKGSSERILYDAGLTRDSTVHNLDFLGLNPSGYRAVVLFHGHADHHGGLDYGLRDGEIRCLKEAA
jgi:7,8-dihydropterin-6-yl-methyl-4-(beta-D-ribofuranosyl)aminobenzene 5'-phosphate synthase